jgi:hypothetical protein
LNFRIFIDFSFSQSCSSGPTPAGLARDKTPILDQISDGQKPYSASLKHTADKEFDHFTQCELFDFEAQTLTLILLRPASATQPTIRT